MGDAAVCVCVPRKICEHVVFLNHTSCVWTLLGICVLLLQANVCVFPIQCFHCERQTVCSRVSFSVLELQRHGLHKLWVPLLDILDFKWEEPPMKVICSTKKDATPSSTQSRLYLFRRGENQYSDYEKYWSPASSPPALHYRVSPCMKSHLQWWGALRIEVKSINKQVNCGCYVLFYCKYVQ